MNIKRLRILAVLAMLAAGAAGAMAQDANSAYSKFGYGLLRDNATSMQRMMGGTGYAMNSGRQINVMNPASYACIDSLTFLFDTGVTLSNQWSKEGSSSQYSTGGGLDYVTMQFPLGKYMGGSVGLLPFSSVGYSFGSTVDNGKVNRSGEGGLNELYLGVSGRPFKGFSLGFNISYLFGTTYNHVYVSSNVAPTTLFSQEMQVNDFHINLGAQYSFKVGSKSRLTLGLTYSPSKTLLGRTIVSTAEERTSNNTTSFVVVDTIVNTSLKNKFSLPETWGAGINYQWNNRLMLEADFTYQNWEKAKYAMIENFMTTEFQNRWKAAVGGQYIPNPRGNYLQRINYRAGAHYGNDYIKVNGNGVREWGVSCGFGLPAPGQKTMINLGIEYVNRQAHPNPLLKENYLNITLGVNFNELWFWQNKIR